MSTIRNIEFRLLDLPNFLGIKSLRDTFKIPTLLSPEKQYYTFYPNNINMSL